MKVNFLDGAMGTMLLQRGLKLGDVGEILNFTHSDMIQAIHKMYLEAGSDWITTHTFGANPYRLRGTSYTVEEVIKKAVENAKSAMSEVGRGKIVLDVGPTGERLEPAGHVKFEELYHIFKEQVVLGEKLGVDYLLFETFTDIEELKAGVRAAKENTALPILATMTFEESGCTYFGTTVQKMVETLEAIGVEAMGVNCGKGAKAILPVVRQLVEMTSTPIIVQPSVGLPVMKEGIATYTVTPDEFADTMKVFAQMGVSILGGCCGTNEKYIKKMVERINAY